MRWVVRGLAAVAVLAVLATLGLYAADRLSQPPTPDVKALIARGGAYDVRIRRDEFGVPHILGKTDAGAAFGVGYAHSEDDFATIQDVMLAVRGTLAAKDGPKAATTDYLVRLFRIWPNVDAHYAELPADLRHVMEAYADGVNAYAARHMDKVAPGFLPATGKDVAAGFMFKTPFFYGLDETLKRLTARSQGKPPLPVGSNAIAVAPSRSADGATRLLVNSHQPFTGPVAWYEAVVQSGEGWHMAGGLFPGSPFVLHGFNPHLGWANTVNSPNLVTLYRLTLNPNDPNQYRLDGAWRAFEKSDAAFKVRLFGPLVITVHKDVLWSAHGPVLKTDHGVFAVRYAGMGETRQALQYYRLDKAETREQWLAAMRLQALPSINYIYADETGTIGYVYNAEFPNRREGIDWTKTQPGDRSDLIWNGYLPFDQVPQIWRPKSGFVFNSNNTPFRATGPEDQLKPADFSPAMGIQTNMTNRALRAEETFGADPRISAEAFRRYKFDLRYSPRSDMMALMRRLTSIDPKGDPDLAAAQAVLRGWDGRADVQSRGAALAILTALPVLKPPAGAAPPEPVAALKAAARTLKAHFGRIDPEWGDVNRIRRGGLDLPIDGGPDTYRAIYGEPQADGRLKAVAGDTLIIFVAWDKAGKVSAESVHPFGSATLDRASRHYADQTPLFAAMKTKPVRFTEAELIGHVQADYRPGDAHP
jgi:penicillin amidase/acyl-homoserine-lactone acylase